MTIPNFQKFMLPILQQSSDGKPHTLIELWEPVAEMFNISEEEKKEKLKTGGQSRYYNRLNWARSYLKKAGLLFYPERGAFQITERGREVLSQNPVDIDIPFLKQFEEFNEFQERKTNQEDKRETEGAETPEELIESTYKQLRKTLADELIDTVKGCSPTFFERLVIDLLVKMGYGGTRQDAGQALGKSGDEGIDGIIKEDRLGLDVIYIQAKRWEGVVGRPEIQKFVGALQGKRARKGIFITTSHFTKEAREYASNIENKVILLDGDDVANLMLDYNIGVATEASYEIKRIDSDYFIEG